MRIRREEWRESEDKHVGSLGCGRGGGREVAEVVECEEVDPKIEEEPHKGSKREEKKKAEMAEAVRVGGHDRGVDVDMGEDERGEDEEREKGEIVEESLEMQSVVEVGVHESPSARGSRERAEQVAAKNERETEAHLRRHENGPIHEDGPHVLL